MGKAIDKALVDARKRVFLEEYGQSGIVGPCLDAAGISRSTYRRWRHGIKVEGVEPDAEFAAACDDAFEHAVDEAEAELRNRGVHGCQEVVLFRGEPVWRRDPNTGDVLLDDDFEPIPFTISRRSDRLLEVYTRTHRPQYKEKSEVAVTGAGGGAVETVHTVRYVLPDGKTEADYGSIALAERPFDPLED